MPPRTRSISVGAFPTTRPSERQRRRSCRIGEAAHRVCLIWDTKIWLVGETCGESQREPASYVTNLRFDRPTYHLLNRRSVASPTTVSILLSTFAAPGAG